MYNWFGRFCSGFYHSGSFIYGGIFMMIIGLLLVIAVIYFLFRKDSVSSSREEESPLELLRKRYVNGEISKEEYLTKKKIIS